jgi:hypothetical protein
MVRKKEEVYSCCMNVGKLYYFNQNVYEGDWKNDLKNGRGKSYCMRYRHIYIN